MADNQNEVNKTPGEWEQDYMNHVAGLVRQNEQFMAQQLQNVQMGMYYGPEQLMWVINTLQYFRQQVAINEPASQWFTERNLPTFPAYLKTTLDNMDKAIAIHTQTYQNSLSHQAAAFQPTVNSNNDIFKIQLQTGNDLLKMQQEANEKTRASFDEMNKKWMDNFMKR